jgi:isopentenyl diphosphate isomerase/L-lactate dehydrogenase-like FMN-dependent dehydrogenase
LQSDFDTCYQVDRENIGGSKFSRFLSANPKTAAGRHVQLGEIYSKGKAYFRHKDFGRLLDYAETGFIAQNDRAVLDRYTFRQRCIDATEASTRVTVLGTQLATPVIMSAMTMPIPAMADNAMLELARGLKAAGSLMWTGTPLPKDLAQIAATGVPLAANVKPFKDRGKMDAEIDEIVAAGVTWIGIEIDAGQGTKVADTEMGMECSPCSSEEIAKIKNKVKIPLACKGVLSRDDAEKSVDAGADILVVSNHGGHTCDYLPHPLQVLDEIVPAVEGRATIVADGGFRRGSDVLKGLALGAALVGLGRPILYGLAAGGRDGVTDLIGGITRELLRIMTMTGTAAADQATREILIERHR